VDDNVVSGRVQAGRGAGRARSLVEMRSAVAAAASVRDYIDLAAALLNEP
jgi:hypothetical protein